MTSQPDELAPPSEPDRRNAVRHAEVALRSMGQPNSVAGEFDFWDDRYEGRRLFSELLGTFFLVLVAVGGGMVSARFGGSAVPYGAKVVAPALMVMAIILFMGTVSGAHLNPASEHRVRGAGRLPVEARPGLHRGPVPRRHPGHVAAVGADRQAGQRGPDPARPRHLDDNGDAVGTRPYRRAWSA